MINEERLKFSQRYARFNRQPQSLLGKIVALLLGASFLVLAFMFSLVVLAVVAVGGVLIGGWLWWKTRAIRQQMRAMQQMQQASPQASAARSPDEGYVIEGEVIGRSNESVAIEEKRR